MEIMSLRSEARFSPNQVICITVFGEPDRRLRAVIRNVSARGVGLVLKDPVAVGSALKFDLEDSMILGEVIYCRRDEESYYVGVELEQALRGLAGLARALREFSDSPSGREQADPVEERRYQD